MHFNFSNIIFSFLLYLQLINLSFAQSQHQFQYGYTMKVKVARVIDGDTFVLTDSQRVRLLGIDTPELFRNGQPAEPYSDSAYNLTKSLVEGKIIKLTFEFSPLTKGGNTKGVVYDIFSRLLAYAWLTNTEGKDSLFIQVELLKKGYARIAYYNKQKRYYDIFYNLRRTARKNKLGIWKDD